MEKQTTSKSDDEMEEEIENIEKNLEEEENDDNIEIVEEDFADMEFGIAEEEKAEENIDESLENIAQNFDHIENEQFQDFEPIPLHSPMFSEKNTKKMEPELVKPPKQAASNAPKTKANQEEGSSNEHHPQEEETISFSVGGISHSFSQSIEDYIFETNNKNSLPEDPKTTSHSQDKTRPITVITDKKEESEEDLSNNEIFAFLASNKAGIPLIPQHDVNVEANQPEIVNQSPTKPKKGEKTPNSSHKITENQEKTPPKPEPVETLEETLASVAADNAPIHLDALGDEHKEIVLNLLSTASEQNILVQKTIDGDILLSYTFNEKEMDKQKNNEFYWTQLMSLGKKSNSPQDKRGTPHDKGKADIKPLDWVLRLIEEIYNARYHSLLNEITSEDGLIENFTSFVHNFFSKRYGLSKMVHQATTELLKAVKYHREKCFHVDLFAMFLVPNCNLVDLLFFLHAWSIALPYTSNDELTTDLEQRRRPLPISFVEGKLKNLVANNSHPPPGPALVSGLSGVFSSPGSSGSPSVKGGASSGGAFGNGNKKMRATMTPCFLTGYSCLDEVTSKVVRKQPKYVKEKVFAEMSRVIQTQLMEEIEAFNSKKNVTREILESFIKEDNVQPKVELYYYCFLLLKQFAEEREQIVEIIYENQNSNTTSKQQTKEVKEKYYTITPQMVPHSVRRFDNSLERYVTLHPNFPTTSNSFTAAAGSISGRPAGDHETDFSAKSQSSSTITSEDEIEDVDKEISAIPQQQQNSSAKKSPFRIEAHSMNEQTSQQQKKVSPSSPKSNSSAKGANSNKNSTPSTRIYSKTPNSSSKTPYTNNKVPVTPTQKTDASKSTSNAKNDKKNGTGDKKQAASPSGSRSSTPSKQFYASGEENATSSGNQAQNPNLNTSTSSSDEKDVDHEKVIEILSILSPKSKAIVSNDHPPSTSSLSPRKR